MTDLESVDPDGCMADMQSGIRRQTYCRFLWGMIFWESHTRSKVLTNPISNGKILIDKNK